MSPYMISMTQLALDLFMALRQEFPEPAGSTPGSAPDPAANPAAPSTLDHARIVRLLNWRLVGDGPVDPLEKIARRLAAHGGTLRARQVLEHLAAPLLAMPQLIDFPGAKNIAWQLAAMGSLTVQSVLSDPQLLAFYSAELQPVDITQIPE